MSAHQISGMGMASWDSLKIAARRDPDIFCEFVLREKRKGAPEIPGRGIQGEPVVQHRIHSEMQAAVTEHRHVVVMGAPEFGKTMQLGVGRSLFEIGNNLDAQLAFIGNTQGAAKKTLGAVKAYIERSDELRAVFPKLKPGALWTSEQITVERSSASRDPSIQTVGYHGDILGARIDGWVADDFLDFENTRTEEARRESERWFRQSVLTRELEGAWGAFLCNAWHERDMTGSLRRDGWCSLTYPVLGEDGLATWPERWSLARIADVRKTIGIPDFIRLYMCKPRDETTRTFMKESLEAATTRGEGYTLLDAIPDWVEERGILVVSSVDLGASRRRGGKTVVTTSVFHPDRTKQVVSIRGGRGSGTWLFQQLADVGERYGGTIVVEDNGIQKMIVEIAQSHGVEIPVPVVPFQTGRNKHDPSTGIAAMASEFDSQEWIIPEKNNPEVKELLADMEGYDPEVHTGDYLMSLWIGRTWARRKMRAMERPDGQDLTVIGLGTSSKKSSRDPKIEKLREELRLKEVVKTSKDPVERSLAIIEIERLEKRNRARAGAVTLDDIRAGS